MDLAEQVTMQKPAILEQVRPAEMPRRPLVENDRDLNWMTEKICGIVEEKTPKWWWYCFGTACFIAMFTVVGLTYLVATGVGVWGVA